MLCSFCPLCTVFITADVEAQNKIWDITGLFTLKSSLVYVALALIIGAIFFRTLYINLPMLMTQEYIDSSWDYLFLVSLSLSALILWSVTFHPNLATVGRLRPAALIFLWLFLMSVLLLYHVFWWTAEKIIQAAYIILQAQGNSTSFRIICFNSQRARTLATRIFAVISQSM